MPSKNGLNRRKPNSRNNYIQPKLKPVIDEFATETARTINGLIKEEANATTPLEKKKIENAIREAIAEFQKIKALHARLSDRRKN